MPLDDHILAFHGFAYLINWRIAMQMGEFENQVLQYLWKGRTADVWFVHMHFENAA